MAREHNLELALALEQVLDLTLTWPRTGTKPETRFGLGTQPGTGPSPGTKPGIDPGPGIGLEDDDTVIVPSPKPGLYIGPEPTREHDLALD